MLPKMFIVSALAALVLSACGSSGVSQNTSDALGQGQTQFTSLCASCHSVNGTGSDLAPSIIGLPGDAIKAQIRNPNGAMPAFSAEVLSDANLDLLVQFVLSLGGSDETADEEITPSEQEKVHLMAAYEAIADYQNMDRETAINRLQQAIALASGTAAAKYTELIEAIQDGKAGTARYELEELLGITD